MIFFIGIRMNDLIKRCLNNPFGDKHILFLKTLDCFGEFMGARL